MDHGQQKRQFAIQVIYMFKQSILYARLSKTGRVMGTSAAVGRAGGRAIDRVGDRAASTKVVHSLTRTILIRFSPNFVTMLMGIIFRSSSITSQIVKVTSELLNW